MLGKFLGREPFLALKHETFSPVFSIYRMKEINLSHLLTRLELGHMNVCFLVSDVLALIFLTCLFFEELIIRSKWLQES